MDNRATFLGPSQRAMILIVVATFGTILFLLIFSGVWTYLSGTSPVALLAGAALAIVFIVVIGMQRAIYEAAPQGFVMETEPAWPLAVLARRSSRTIPYGDIDWIDVRQGGGKSPTIADLHLKSGELVTMAPSGGTDARVRFVRFTDALRAAQPDLFRSGGSEAGSMSVDGTDVFTFRAILGEPQTKSGSGVVLGGLIGGVMRGASLLKQMADQTAIATVTLSPDRLSLDYANGRGGAFDIALADVTSVIDHRLGLEFLTRDGARHRVMAVPMPADATAMRKLVHAFNQRVPGLVTESPAI